MPLVRCKICGRYQGQSEWFKTTQVADKCATCLKEDEEAMKLTHERELEKIKKTLAAKKDEITHQKDAKLEIIDRRGEKAEEVAQIWAGVELEKVKALREFNESRCKIAQDMVQSGQAVDHEMMRSLFGSLTIQFTPLDSFKLNEQIAPVDSDGDAMSTSVAGDENIDD